MEFDRLGWIIQSCGSTITLCSPALIKVVQQEAAKTQSKTKFYWQDEQLQRLVDPGFFLCPVDRGYGIPCGLRVQEECLDEHIKTTHAHQCQVCFMWFGKGKKRLLDRHVRVKHGHLSGAPESV